MRKGKADSVFTPAGKGFIPPGFFIFRKGRAKKKKRRKNDLSNAMLPRVLTCTKGAGGASLLHS